MVLVDSNVLLDVLTDDPRWRPWSTRALESASGDGLAINPIVYAELSPAFHTEDELEAQLSGWAFARLPLPYEAAFLAGQAFMAYRKRGGQKRSPLPDFYIGAHALVGSLPLLTRDALRYRTYFAKLKLIAPD